MKNIVIVADGGCRRNGQEGAEAYGSFKVFYKGLLKKEEAFVFKEASTNQQAELLIVLQALKYMAGNEIRARQQFQIKTDSEYVIGHLAGSWKLDAAKHPVNAELKKLCLETLKLLPGAELVKVPRNEVYRVLGH